MRSRTRPIAALAAGVTVLAATAACTPTLDKGTVEGRDHSPAWCNTTYIAAGNGVQIPQIACYPEYWILHLRDGDATGDQSVTREVYERCAPDTNYPDCAAPS